MNFNAAQFNTSNQANLQALQGLTTQAYAGVEKMIELNMAASKAALGESFNHVQAVLGAKDAQELMALQAGLLKPLAEKSAAYFQHVQNIATASGAEFTKTVEAKNAEVQKALGGVVENLARNAPAGTESAVAAFQNALTAGQNAVESATIQVKKAVETAQSSFNAAATQAVDAVKKSTRTAKTA